MNPKRDDSAPWGASTTFLGGAWSGGVFLCEGSPGTGKSPPSLAISVRRGGGGQTPLYITLSETEDELRAAAASHGWSLDGIEIFELVPPESLLDEDQQQSLLYSSDLELGETTRRIFEAFERVKPDRVVLDSLSEIRLLAQKLAALPPPDPLAQALLRPPKGATVLMLDDLTTEMNDKTVHSVAHGVVGLEEVVRPIMGPSAGGCASSSIAAGASAAAFTTSPSRPAACRSFRGWSPPSTGGFRARPCWRATAPSSTPCSAAASSAARAS